MYNCKDKIDILQVPTTYFSHILSYKDVGRLNLKCNDFIIHETYLREPFNKHGGFILKSFFLYFFLSYISDFFSINVNYVWNWFIANIILIQQKHFLQLFKMVVNQTECSILKQKPKIFLFPTEKCRPSEIYKRMYDVFGEECFSQKRKSLQIV